MSAARRPQGRITRAHVERCAQEIKQAAQFARATDPYTKGRLSYPSMCGGLGAILSGLVREVCGESAAAIIESALEEAYKEAPRGDA